MAGDRPRRVLQVIEAAEGGAARHAIDLIGGLDRERFEVDVVYSTRRCRGFVEALRDTGRPIGAIRGLPMARGPSPADDLRCLAALVRAMRRGRYDVVHCHSTKAGVLGRVAARMAGVPRVVYTPHGWAFWDRSGAMRCAIETMERGLARWTGTIVAVSHREAELARKARIEPGATIVTLPNGVNADAIAADVSQADIDAWRLRLGVGADDILIVGLGRLVPQKGFDKPIDAAPRIHPPSGGRVVIAIGGDGPLRDRLKRRIAEGNAGDRAVLLGHIDRPRPLLAAADIVAMPSRWESCSYTLLEAAALGRPVVAFEGAQPGPMGLAVRQDDAAALAEALSGLVADPDRRNQLGDRARRHVRQHHRLDDMVRGIERIYTEGRTE